MLEPAGVFRRVVVLLPCLVEDFHAVARRELRHIGDASDLISRRQIPGWRPERRRSIRPPPSASDSRRRRQQVEIAPDGRPTVPFAWLFDQAPKKAVFPANLTRFECRDV